jgi:hypothetical protein
VGRGETTYICPVEDCPTSNVTKLVLDTCADEGILIPADKRLARHFDTVGRPEFVVIECVSGHESEYPCPRRPHQ